MQKGFKTINIDERMLYGKSSSFFSKILPVLLFVSFVWLNFYSTMAKANTVHVNSDLYGSHITYMIFSVLFAGIFDYLIFEILFFLYRFCLGFSIYSFMIPKFALKDKFRFWYLIRNVVLGFLFNLRFFFPYIETYLCVFELVANFMLIICLYFDLSREYVEPLVGQFVFKTLAVPVVLYETYSLIMLVVGAL